MAAADETTDSGLWNNASLSIAVHRIVSGSRRRVQREWKRVRQHVRILATATAVRLCCLLSRWRYVGATTVCFSSASLPAAFTHSFSEPKSLWSVMMRLPPSCHAYDVSCIWIEYKTSHYALVHKNKSSSRLTSSTEDICGVQGSEALWSVVLMRSKRKWLEIEQITKPKVDVFMFCT